MWGRIGTPCSSGKMPPKFPKMYSLFHFREAWVPIDVLKCNAMIQEYEESLANIGKAVKMLFMP